MKCINAGTWHRTSTELGQFINLINSKKCLVSFAKNWFSCRDLVTLHWNDQINMLVSHLGEMAKITTVVVSMKWCNSRVLSHFGQVILVPVFLTCHVTEGVQVYPVRNVSLLNEKFKQNVKHFPVFLKNGGILSLLRKDKNLILVE